MLMTPAVVRANDGFVDFLYGLGLTPDWVQRQMADQMAARESVANPAANKAAKTELSPDEVKKFAELAAYFCRDRKALLYQSVHQFLVQGAGSRQPGADCAKGTRHLEVSSLAGRLLSGLSYRFEVSPEGSIKAWTVVQTPPTMGAIGSVPSEIQARLDSPSVQKALEEAIGVWTHYPISAS